MHLIRKRIADLYKEVLPLRGEVEVDENCFSAKRKFIKFHGISEGPIYYYLKECEIRFNNRNTDSYKFLLKDIQNKLLF